MASIINTVKNGSGDFQGVWEDVQWYTTVKVNIDSSVAGELKLHWANPPRGRLPTDAKDLITTTDISYNPQRDINNDPIPITFERDTRARWFRLDFCASNIALDNSLNIEVLYKHAPTSLKLVDLSQNNVVSVANGNLYTVLVDNTGNVLRSTGTTTGEALYTTLRDGSGDALATATGNNSQDSLAIALRDASGNDFDTLFIAGKTNTANAMYVHVTDACGHSQATGRDVSGANVAGLPFYLANLMASTQRTNHPQWNSADFSKNSLYVHATTQDGQSITNVNPLDVTQVSDITEVYAFDISSSITEDWRTHSSLKGGSNRGRVIHDLFTYNDGPTVVWLRVYDLSVNDGSTPSPSQYDLSPYVMHTIPLIPGQHYQTHFPLGIQFNNGVAFRTTVEPTVDSVIGPGPDTVFVAGTYTTIGISTAMNDTAITGWSNEENRLYSHNQSDTIAPLALTVTRDPVTIDGVWTFRWTQPSQYIGDNDYDVSIQTSNDKLTNILGINAGTDIKLDLPTDTSVTYPNNDTSLTNAREYTNIKVINQGSIGNFNGTWAPTDNDSYDTSGLYYSLVKNSFEILTDAVDSTYYQIDQSGYYRFSVSGALNNAITASGAGGDLSFCAISGEFGSYVYMTISGKDISIDASISILSWDDTVKTNFRRYHIDLSYMSVATQPFDGSLYTVIMRDISVTPVL